MKQLSSIMLLNIDGGDRVSYTYNEINEETGDLVSSNNKGSFCVVNDGLSSHINAIRGYIRETKLEV